MQEPRKRDAIVQEKTVIMPCLLFPAFPAQLTCCFCVGFIFKGILWKVDEYFVCVNNETWDELEEKAFYLELLFSFYLSIYRVYAYKLIAVSGVHLIKKKIDGRASTTVISKNTCAA